MNKYELTRIYHMLESAQEAVKFTQGKTFSDLQSDKGLQLILARLLEIAG